MKKMVGIRSCILFYLLINAALVAATGSGISIGAALASGAAIAPAPGGAPVRRESATHTMR